MGVKKDGRVRERADALTAAKRARFLETLAETSSVQQAAVAGMAARYSFYRLRDRDAAFAAAWAAALAQGYETIEGQLLTAAHGGGEAGKFDPQLGLAMLKRRDAAAAGHPGYGRKTTVTHVPVAEIEQAVTTRLAAIAKKWARA